MSPKRPKTPKNPHNPNQAKIEQQEETLRKFTAAPAQEVQSYWFRMIGKCPFNIRWQTEMSDQLLSGKY